MSKNILALLLCILVATPVLAAPASSQTNLFQQPAGLITGYNRTIEYLGIIKNLVRDENQTTFTGVVGFLFVISKSDDGGIWVAIGTLNGVDVVWPSKWTFTGFLGKHVICGKIQYRAE
jgi:hypothetical protein